MSLMPTELITNLLKHINNEINGVIKLLNQFNPLKAIGPDNIHARILKETSSEIAPVLALIFLYLK